MPGTSPGMTVGEITREVRDYAARLNERAEGMEAMSDKFRELGGEVYVDKNALT